jgi:hypothetical protein
MKKISQSLIRELVDKTGYPTRHCPLEILEKYYVRNPLYSWSSDAMVDGQFGETLLLGGGARGQIVNQLPITKLGKVPVREGRIRQQALNAQVKIFTHKIDIYQNVNTQTPCACYFEDTDWVISTELDLFPTKFYHDKEKQDVLACIDVKFTNQFSAFAYNAWEDYANMDKIQPDSIFYMFEHFDLELTKELFPEYDARVGVENMYTPALIERLNEYRFF